MALRDTPCSLWVELRECADCHRIRWCLWVLDWQPLAGGGLRADGSGVALCRPCLGRDAGYPIT